MRQRKQKRQIWILNENGHKKIWLNTSSNLLTETNLNFSDSEEFTMCTDDHDTKEHAGSVIKLHICRKWNYSSSL